jgi:hypothetical protein
MLYFAAFKANGVQHTFRVTHTELRTGEPCALIQDRAEVFVATNDPFIGFTTVEHEGSTYSFSRHTPRVPEAALVEWIKKKMPVDWDWATKSEQQGALS